MSPFQRWLLLGSSAGTGLTGIVYAWMKYLLEPTEPWAVINHPWEPWVLKAHILVAPVLVFAVGLIASEHIWKHFRARVRARRVSGLTLMTVVVPMVLSGYLIQAVTGAGWLAALVVVHLVTGGLYLVAVGAHWQARGRRANGGARGEERAGGVAAERGGPDVVHRRRADGAARSAIERAEPAASPRGPRRPRSRA